jgi:hypothetical protein
MDPITSRAIPEQKHTEGRNFTGSYFYNMEDRPGGVRIDGTAKYLTAIQNTQFLLPHYYNALFAGLLLLIYLN